MFCSWFRLRAFFLHLLVSTTLAMLTLMLVFWVWYPDPLQKATGVTGIYLLLLIVDVILGPCLTLAVAAPEKKKHLLIMDFSIIILVQAGAFAYGLYTVAEGRPAWIVLAANRFNLVTPAELDKTHREDALPEFQIPPLTGPRWISAPMPVDLDKKNDIIFGSFGGLEIYQRPEYFQPLEKDLVMIAANAQALEDLKRYNPATEVAEKLAPYPDADAFLPLRSELWSMTVLVRKDESRIIAVVDLRPWEE
jgi:hypothetical protein